MFPDGPVRMEEETQTKREDRVVCVAHSDQSSGKATVRDGRLARSARTLGRQVVHVEEEIGC